MKTLPDQPGFEEEYVAVKGQRREVVARMIPRSVNDLVTRYYRSADFVSKGNDDTRQTRRGRIEPFRIECGDDLVSDFSFEHIEAMLITKTEKVPMPGKKNRMMGGEVAARNLRKELLRLFAYAKKLKWIDANPVEDAEKVGRAKLKGYHTWTEDEIAQYQRKHPIGTKARLALEVILWTGQRRGDARLFGPKHIVNGKVNYKASKNSADLWLRMATDLRAAIAAMPSVGITTFLVTDYGKPFTKEGFGNKMRDWCDEAGLPQCSAHGLRKAIGRRMAQIRLSDEQMMAVGGWKSSSQVRTYTEAVDQEELADGAMAAIDSRYSTSKVPQND